VNLEATRSDTEAESVGRYRILSLLGRGSMAKVYLAQDPVVDRKIALKVISPAGPVDAITWQTLRSRFLLEARAAGKLHHPNAVSIFDADTDEESGLAYIAMEWVDGRSLDELLSTRGPIDVEASVSIIQQIANALDAAHQQGLIHRDVKPGNILIDRSEQAKLSDFGIVKFQDMRLTSTGGVMGTPLYMSPEQVRGLDLDGRSDLFSLGVVLYQCLTGSPPFSGDTVAELTYQIQHSNPRAPQWVNPAIPGPLAATVLRSIAKDPRARPQTGAELGRQLAMALENPSHLAEAPDLPLPVTPTVRLSPTEIRAAMEPPEVGGAAPRRVSSLLFIAFAIVTIVAIATLFWTDSQPQDRSSPSTSEDPAALSPTTGPSDSPGPKLQQTGGSSSSTLPTDETPTTSPVDSTQPSSDEDNWLDQAEEVLDDAERIYKISVGKGKSWWNRVGRNKSDKKHPNKKNKQ